MKDQLEDFLGTTQMFKGLPAEQLSLLAKITKVQVYEKEETLFSQGDEGTGFFIVKSGKIKVFQLSAEGKEQILHLFESKEHFAEVPAFDGLCFPACAAAVVRSEVLFFSREDFLNLLNAYPQIAINILSVFARHLRRFAHLIENLSLREVPGRLAAYLLNLSEQQNNSEIVKLDLTKGQLAAVLGTIPETLSRGLAKLTQEGLISTDGLSIRLLNRQGLLQRAGKIV
ncbi:Crp/Fnr family transcriptional regulator [Gloeothece verrucosa]|uniref:Transcriptional regulator, Crp/Fnr family n=1 Tax=Gloeothece verrucosa (strain PCC 7822) TaxID=497965 RepID=E0UK51_GLOV7|nr:Crp/Fnr family transcriptional regulator [Gloeothece verrucosa]ADN15813.1 transcriptional regulator, Crp/Fnr family [Gloeothece verrucosa PCC 7822]